MTDIIEERELVSSILLFSSSCLEKARVGVKKSAYTIKKLDDLKEKVLETYRARELSYESFCTILKILNDTIEIIETTSWYFLD